MGCAYLPGKNVRLCDALTFQEKVYGCLVFPCFEVGVAFMRHVALNKLQPASIRLMDKRQTQCGALFRAVPPGSVSLLGLSTMVTRNLELKIHLLFVCIAVLLYVRLSRDYHNIPAKHYSVAPCSPLLLPTGGLGLRDALTDGIKSFYLNRIKGWREEDLCACTLLFEGSSEEVAAQQRNIYKAAKRFGGLPAGAKNGQRGYQMTFLIAYVR